MAKDCFCECGRTVPRFPLGMRAINTRGRQVRERVEWARETFGEREELEAWYADGDEIVSLLARACHGEIDPRGLDERAIRAWQADGRHLQRQEHQAMKNIGRMVRESGLSPEEFAQAYARGDIELTPTER